MMSLNCYRDSKDHNVTELPRSVRSNGKLSLSIHHLTNHEALGVVVASPYSSMDGRPYSLFPFHPLMSSRTQNGVQERSTASPHLLLRLYSTGRIERLENMLQLGLSSVSSSLPPAGCYDPPMYSPTLHAHVTSIYDDAEQGHAKW